MNSNIVIYGNIYTVDKKNPKASALAISDGKFVYVGDEEGVKDYIDKDTEEIRYYYSSGIWRRTRSYRTRRNGEAFLRTSESYGNLTGTSCCDKGVCKKSSGNGCYSGLRLRTYTGYGTKRSHCGFA